MDHFASTAGSFKGKDRDFKSMGASSGPDWLSGSAAPRPPPAAADRDFKSMGASSGPDWLSGSAAPRPPPRGRGRVPGGLHGQHGPPASTAGSFKGKDRDFKSMGASSGPDWLSGSAAPRPPPRGRGRVPGGLHGQHGPLRPTAGSFKGKDRDFKSMGASSGPDWLSGSAAPRPPRGRGRVPGGLHGQHGPPASTAGSLQGQDRDFKSMGASSGPDWLSGSAAPRPPPRPRSRPRRPPRATWTTASTAGSFKGKDRDFKSMGAASGPAGSPARPPRGRGRGKDRDFKSMGASSGPDWLSGSAAPAAAAPAAAVASPAASTGNMDHFASTAGSFKGKDRDFKSMGAASGPAGSPARPPRGRGRDRDFKSMGASSGPDWLSGSAAPRPPPRGRGRVPGGLHGQHGPPASTAGSFKGKDRDFKSMGASSGPDWLSGSAAPRRPRGRGRVPGGLHGQHGPPASTAGSFKGKDRDFKSMGASSGPDWLSGSAAPRPPPRGRGRDRDFKSMGASSGPSWLSGSAAPRPPPRGRGRVPGGLHGQHGPPRPRRARSRARTATSSPWAPRPAPTGSPARPPRGRRPAAAVASPAASTGNMDHFASTAGSFKGKDRDFKSMGAASGPDWLSGSAAPAAAVASPAASTGNMDHFASTAGSFKGKDRDFKSMGASSGPDWLSGSAAPRPPPRGRGRVPGGLHGQHGPPASTAGSLKGKDRDFKSMGASSGPDWLSGSAAPAAAPDRGRGKDRDFKSMGASSTGPRLGRFRGRRPAAAVASPAASTGNMDHFASTAGSFKGKDRDFKSMGASSGPDWLSGSAAPRPPPRGRATSMAWLRLCALSAGVAAFQNNAPTTKRALEGLRAAWLEEQQFVAGLDGQSNDEAEVAVRAALDAIRADGRLVNDKEAEQAAWEAAWIAVKVANLERLKNEKNFAAKAAEDVKGYVPPLGGRAAGSLDTFTQEKPKAVGGSSAPAWLAGNVAGLGEQSAAEQALASMEQERVAAAAPAAAAASGSMDHFASTAGSFKGKDRDFKAMGAASGPEWLSGSAAPAAAPAATAAPAKAASTGNMDHFASTAGSFKGKDRDFKSMGASGPSGSPAPPPLRPPPLLPRPRRPPRATWTTSRPRRARSGQGPRLQGHGRASGPEWLSGSAALRPPLLPRPRPPPRATWTTSSTAGSFKGKDRDFKAMGAASGPEWLSGSAAPAAVAPAAASPAASTGNMDHFASTAGSFKGKDRDFKAMGASSGPDWLAGTPFATAAPVALAAAPAKAAASGNMDHFASTAGSFKGKDRDFKSMGAASGPEWLSGSAAASSAPPATAAPAKAASGSMDHFASTAGSFKGKDRDFKSMGAASGPEWLSGSAALRPPLRPPPLRPPPLLPPRPPPRFDGPLCGKDRDFKSMGASSGPDWLSGSAAPRPPPPAAVASPAASTGNMDHFASTAGSLKGKDRDFKSMGAAPPAKAAASGNMDHFASHTAAVGGNKDHFASHIAAVAEAQAPQLSPAQAKRLSLRAKHHGFLEGPGRRTRQLRTPRSSPHSWTSFTN
ncbi:ATPase [Aureococcus anophagefferens]|nr:ATPase [Aureococcus anophagefferens]